MNITTERIVMGMTAVMAMLYFVMISPIVDVIPANWKGVQQLIDKDVRLSAIDDNRSKSGSVVFAGIKHYSAIRNSHQSVKSEQYDSSLLQSSTTLEALVDSIKASSIGNSVDYENALANSSASRNELALIYFEIGNHFYFQRQYDKSVTFYARSAEMVHAVKEAEFLCRVYLGTGNAYLLDWKNPEALNAYHKLLMTASDSKNLNYQIIAKSNIAIVLRRMNQLEKALTNCRDLLDMINETSFKNAFNHVNILTIICEVHLDLKQYDSVMYYAQTGIEISQPLGYQIGLLDLHTKMGIVFYQKNEVDQALEQFALAESIIAEEKPSPRSAQVINVNYFLASYYYDIESYQRAIEYLQRTIDAVEENDLRKNRVIDSYLLLAKCHYEMGNEAQSILAFSKYDELSKEFEQNKDRTVSEIHARGTLELREKIEQLEMNQKKSGQNRRYIVIGLVFMTVGVTAISMLYYFKERSNKLKFEKLIGQISQLESNKNQVLTGTNEGMKQIPIDDEKVGKILKELDKLENKEYFLRLDCNLREMAKKIKTNATYLSQIINKHKGRNFNDYIRDLRIDYVLKRLKNDRKFRSYSIKFIALEVGYKSDNSFTKHFRAKTKLNPSYYIKNIDKLQVQETSSE